MPAALHSLGCSAEEIAAALERRRATETAQNALKGVQRDTEEAELGARRRVAEKDNGAREKLLPQEQKPKGGPESNAGD